MLGRRFYPLSAFTLVILLLITLGPGTPIFAYTTATTPPALTATAKGTIDFDGSSRVLEDGTLWTWAYVPVQVYGLSDVVKTLPYNLIMKADKSIWHWESTGTKGDFKVTQLQGISDIKTIVYGDGDLIALSGDGYLYAIAEKPGSIVDPSIAAKRIEGISDITAICKYYRYDFDHTNPDKPVIINSWVALKSDGTVWLCDGQISKKPFTKIPSVSDGIAIQAQQILKGDGSVWQWSPDLSVSKLDIDGNVVFNEAFTRGKQLGITQEGRLWFWGYTVTGWSDGKEFHKNKPLMLNQVNQVKDACIVEESLIVLDEAGNLYETSLRTEALDANAPFRKLMSGVVSLKPSYRHLIFQTEDGRLWGWGINKHGDLGVGTNQFSYENPMELLDPVTVYLDKTLMQLPKGAMILNGQSFIPLRSILEKLGATVEWNALTKVARVYRQASGKPKVDILLDYKLGTITLNGEPVALTNKPLLVVDAAYIPLRFMSENLGYKVEWFTKGPKHTIIIRP